MKALILAAVAVALAHTAAVVARADPFTQFGIWESPAPRGR
jgi:hypothetical protein